MQKQLVVRPIGNLIEPCRPAVEKQKRKPEREKQRALKNFEERNDLEISDAPVLFENSELVRMCAHRINSSMSFAYSAMIGLSRQQISNLLPSGSSKKHA